MGGGDPLVFIQTGARRSTPPNIDSLPPGAPIQTPTLVPLTRSLPFHSPPLLQPATAESAPSPPTLPPLAVAGAALTAGGAPVTLVGANWFGFENGQTFVDGLWAGSGTALTHDALTVLWRIKLLGFNALRLPFSFKVGERIRGEGRREEGRGGWRRARLF